MAKSWPQHINFPVQLAPMVGLSHVALRRMVLRYLPANAETIWPTEMLSSWRLGKEKVGETPETFKHASERNLCPQILGNEEPAIAEAVRRLEEWGAVAVDINMGCPVKKALRHNYGVALMGDADYAAEVVAMTVRNARVPVSVKLRAGMQKDPEYLLRFTKGLEAAGAAWITIHPRLGSEKRRGRADWEQIAFLRKNLSIPVVGNGDVQTADDVFTMLETTGCHAVMVGRALAARPWMLWQVGARLGMKNPIGLEGDAPTSALDEGAEYGRALKFFVECLREHFEESAGMTRLRFHVRMSQVWLEFGQTLFSKMSKCQGYNQALAAVDEFFSGPQKMNQKTQLRE